MTRILSCDTARALRDSILPDAHDENASSVIHVPSASLIDDDVEQLQLLQLCCLGCWSGQHACQLA